MQEMEAGGEGVVVQVANEDEDEGMGKEGKEIKEAAAWAGRSGEGQEGEMARGLKKCLKHLLGETPWWSSG